MLGRWDTWYKGLVEPATYGDPTTYILGARWLEECELVEDWGVGKGGFQLFREGETRGIDGSATPFADVTADLASYTSKVCGIFIRHVLEHNYEWRTILSNACSSAAYRIFLALFTPVASLTHEIAFNQEIGVPDISFSLSDVADVFYDHGFIFRATPLQTGTQYGVETIFEAERE